MIFNPHKYQIHAKQHILNNPYCGLFMEMGLGKTVVCLEAMDELLFDEMSINRPLVIAPLRVCNSVWKQEGEKWDHLAHLRISVATGSARERVTALVRPADIYVINRENVPWLVGFFQTAFPFDMVVIDELSSFKDCDAKRFKSLKMVRPLIKRVVGLTGTPAGNGLIDLWPEIYLLDRGQRLGPTITQYRSSYFFRPDPFSRYRPNGGAEKQITDSIKDICISMKAEDYLEMPEKIELVKYVKLNRETWRKYILFERDQVMEIAGEELTAINAAVLTGKLLQFANGAIYNQDKEVVHIHDEKLDELGEIIDTVQGQNVLVFYSYKHDLARIIHRFGGEVLKGDDEVERWNKGEIPLLIAHPASAGHGLNLQAGGNIIIWFGLPWSLELYQQATARLWRQGQLKPVLIYKLLCKGTMDEDVDKAQAGKAKTQDNMMAAVKALVEKYLKSANFSEENG